MVYKIEIGLGLSICIGFILVIGKLKLKNYSIKNTENGIQAIQIHQHLEKQAKKLGSKKIASNVHVDNVAMKLNCEKLGRKTSYHRMEKELE